ncbi:MOP flippase family protein [Thermodesulfobacteriota bacterium]
MSELKTKTVTSVRWTTLNTISTTVINFVQIAVLARLLDPKAFGLIAIANLIFGYARVFLDMGLSSAIIQRPNPNKAELSTLYWINVLTGLLIYGVIVLITPFATSLFEVEELQSLLPVIGLSFLISAFSTQFSVLLRKYLRFDVITKINIYCSLFVMTITIYLAWKGYGVWSIVYGSLSGTFLHSVALIFWAGKNNCLPGLHFKFSDTKGYIKFGLYLVGAMLVNQFNIRVDQLIIGLLLGPTSLGYYNIASNLVLRPIQRLNPILTKVAFPIFSIIQNDAPRLKKGFLEMMRILMSINSPVLIGLATVAPGAVLLILGEKWLPAVPIVQALAFFSLVRSAVNASGSLLIAKGKANWTLYWNLVLAAIIPPVIYIASLRGELFYIAIAMVVMQVIIWYAHYFIFIRNLIGPCFFEYLEIAIKPILLSFIMSAILLQASYVLTGLSEIGKLLMQVVIGIFVYGILCWIFQKQILHRFFEFFLDIFPGNKILKRLTNMSSI